MYCLWIKVRTFNNNLNNMLLFFIFMACRSQAHSKAKTQALCAMCHGPIEVFLNQKDKDGKINFVKPKEVNGFAKFVQENYKTFKEPGRAHACVMKILSTNFAQLTVQEKLKYKK